MANDDAPSPVLYLFHEGKTELGYLQALAKNRDIRIVPMPSVSALSPSAQEPASASCPLKNSAASRNRPTRRFPVFYDGIYLTLKIFLFFL